jgi:hypothetical protein
MDNLDRDLEAVREIQLRLIETALRLSGGDPRSAAAYLLGTGLRWSLEFRVDGLDLFDLTSEAIAAHWAKKDSH